MSKRSILYSLQGLRIIAAFIVLLFHIVFILEEKLGIFGYRSFFNFGKSGVHLFFVLSGYVMYMVHKKDIGLGLNKGISFAWKRFVRIYPTYWVLTTFVVISMFVLPGEVKEYKKDFWYIFQSYSLIELGLMKGLAIIPPAWSLFHEVKFYFFFFLLIIIPNKKIRTLLIFLSILLTVINPIIIVSWEENILTNFYLSRFNLLFVYGVLSAWITDRYKEHFKSVYFLIVSILIFLSVAALSNFKYQEDSVFMNLLFGFSSFMLITSLACYELFKTSKNGKSPFRIGKKGLLLADATYCLYLIHIPVYLVVYKVYDYLEMPLWSFIIVMLISATVAALIYYQLIELPLINKIKNIIGKKKSPTLVAEKQIVDNRN